MSNPTPAWYYNSGEMSTDVLTTDQKKEVDKLWEDNSLEIMATNSSLFTSENCNVPNEDGLDDLENNIDELLNMLNCASNGHAESSKYSIANDFIQKYG
jgi:hypothetical protein